MKYRINKEFFPLYYFSAPVLPPKIAGFFGALLKPPRRIFRDKEISVVTMEIKSYQDGKIKIYIMSPEGIADESPCIVYYHGGGFVYGAASNHYYLCKEYALRANCKIVFVDYRLAPKYQFPIPAEDCYAAYLWTVENSKQLQIVKNKIAVAGDSAGGNLTAAVSLMARDRGAPLPLFQMMIYPVTDRRMLTESMRAFRDTPMWNGELSVGMWNAYIGNDAHDHIEYASPIEAASLSGLPDSYMETAEFDCLRDEGLEYGRKLEAEGVDVHFYHTNGTMHAFDSVRNAPTTRAAITERVEYIKNKFYT